MERLLTNHKQQLIFTAIICLLGVLIVSSGHLFVSFLDLKNKINMEQYAWSDINRNIESGLPQVQRQEWKTYARNNPTTFLRANTARYFSANNLQNSSSSRDIIADSFKSILASIVVTTKEHIRRIDQ